MKKKEMILKPVAFLLGLIILVMGISPLFKIEDWRIYQTIHGFYEEPDNSLDAVYVGASNVYAYWQAPLAWGEHGIAVYPVSVPDMPPIAIKYVIEGSRKTQPDALYIVNINALKKTSYDPSVIHAVSDYLPMSRTKIDLINAMCDYIDIEELERAEYFFPMIRFHSKWNEMTERTFTNEYNGLKGASLYPTFLTKCIDYTGDVRETHETVKLTYDQQAILKDLLDYCENENVKVLFVAVPQVTKDETIIAQINEMCNIIRERGFDVANFQEYVDEFGLDVAVDFYHGNHTNIHGSAKYTSYFGNYIKEKYSLADHRGDPQYADWDAAYDAYVQELAPYMTDFEIERLPRDYTLETPELLTFDKNLVTWKAVEGAEGYAVYRREVFGGNIFSGWERVDVVDANTTQYGIDRIDRFVKYNYTVAPVRYEGDAVFYGNYNPNGITGYREYKAPVMISGERQDNGIAITWEEVPGATQYFIKRKIPGQTWLEINIVGNETLTYVDEYFQEGLPYFYTVGVYEEKDDQVFRSTTATAILVPANLPAPEVETEITEDGKCTLFWDPVKGATHYYVYQYDDSDGWKLVEKMASGGETSCTVEIAQEETYYQVHTVLSYRDEFYAYESETITVKGGNE